jgi:hypothetical protein
MNDHTNRGTTMNSLGHRLAHAAREARRWAGELHPFARWNDGCRRLASTQGQGTVEYVGIVLVVGALLLALKGGFAGNAGKTIGAKITQAVVDAMGNVMGSKG